jgi:hypothetical protein
MGRDLHAPLIQASPFLRPCLPTLPSTFRNVNFLSNLINRFAQDILYFQAAILLSFGAN